MYLLHLELTKSNDLNSFIDFWSQLYSYSNESVYINSITKIEIDENDLQNLYVWKNGMKLSIIKQKSLEQKIVNKLHVINFLKSKDEVELEIFNNEFKNLSAVWKIFLLHIIKPNKYPIYDQHIHRTFLFIHNKDYSELSNTSINNIEKEDFYFNQYLPFINNNKIKNLKKLDEAFFAFGQFLNTRNNKVLLE